MNRFKYLAVLVSLLAGYCACTKMDDFLKFTEGINQIYIGRLDSVAFFAGHERVEFYGELSSDPKVSRIGITWNNIEEEYFLDIDFAQDRLIRHSIALPQGSYNFVVHTYDAEGNASIPTTVSGSSYGEGYISGLFNRIVKDCYYEGSDIVVEWYSGSENSPYTIVSYERQDGSTAQLTIATNDLSTVLENPAKTYFDVLSHYTPEMYAVDDFTPETATRNYVTNVTSRYLRNTGPDIEGDERVGDKWGVPKYWNITDNLRNQESNSVGGWSSSHGGCIHLETQDWGGPGFDNGKLWQTVEMHEGTYEFTVYYREGRHSDNQSIHLVVNGGTTLPDRQDLGTAIAYEVIDGNSSEREYKVRFTLDSTQTVSLGLVVTLDRSELYLQFTYFNLEYILD